VLKTGFSFDEKEAARKFFLELRQLFTDRNYLALDDPEYAGMSAEIDAKIAQGSK
jgi:hypothetical protein